MGPPECTLSLPASDILGMHYLTSISKAMKASGEDDKLDDNGEDYEELSEPEQV
jgi:hypothetical protein